MDNFYATEKRLEELKSKYGNIQAASAPSSSMKKKNFKKLSFWKTERTPACCVACC